MNKLTAWIGRVSPLILFLFFAKCAVAAKAVGFGSVAQNLNTSVDFVSGFVESSCFVLGAAFLFATIVKYVEHRRSPLMVPISTVVFLFIAGIVLILLPFAYLLNQNGSS